MMRASRIALVLMVALATSAQAQSYSVFEYSHRSLGGTPGQAVTAIEAQAASHGFRVVSKRTAGVQEDCAFEARVVTLYSEDWGRRLLASNPLTAPYALTDRVVVFSDEQGTHVAFVNPPAVVRTVMLDDAGMAAPALSHRKAVRSFLVAALGPSTSELGYGPERERGFIGKTMGVMAGGPFDEKIQVHGQSAASAESVRAALNTSLSTAGARWGVAKAYEVSIPEAGVYLIGVTGPAMEAKSFQIVGAGSNSDRGGLSCPGLAHAAAYPLELVVRRTPQGSQVEFVDAMYRMKLYFEDAGKWAFMKNMGMPGSIADDLQEAIDRALGGL